MLGPKLKFIRQRLCCMDVTLNKFVKFAIFITIAFIFYLIYVDVFRWRRDNILVGSNRSWNSATKHSPPKEAVPNIETGTILFWTSFFGAKDFNLGYGRAPFQNCPIKNCSATSDRSRLLRAQAVMFHIRDFDVTDMPSVVARNRRHQYWVFYLYESPVNSGINLKSLNNFFNWTMTYRLDSDVPPNLRTEPILRHELPATEFEKRNFARGKTKMAAWIVSNCWTYSHRERYVQELQKFLEVDVYGECGIQNKRCSKQAPLSSCYGVVEKNYKFYLSFENSVCKDYVTEKWYNIVEYDVVPVVYGGANYKLLAPPHSYIDVWDFESAEHLAQYLLLLDSNDTLYNEYFQWKYEYRVVGTQNPWCNLCQKLHQEIEDFRPRTYEDIDKWWNEEGNCLNIMQLPIPKTFVVYANYIFDKLSLIVKRCIDSIKEIVKFYLFV